MGQTKATNVFLWIITAIAGVGFILAGLGKIAGSDEMAARFATWGYPVWFMYLVGLFELAGGICLFMVRFAVPAASALLILMIGAIGTHFLNDQVGLTLPAFVMVILLVSILSLRKEK